MRLLFEMREEGVREGENSYIRPSARCIYIKDNKVAMVYSPIFDYYKFPGGGIEKDESKEEALIREAKEEAGLEIVVDSIRFYGYVHRVEHDSTGKYDTFIQDNYYYFCNCSFEISKQNLDLYEDEAGFTLVFVDYKKAMEVNLTHDHKDTDFLMLKREALVLELLHKEGYLV